jgi:hypothetical protein
MMMEASNADVADVFVYTVEGGGRVSDSVVRALVDFCMTISHFLWC